MKDDDAECLRQMIVQALKECTDTALLDLIYKLIITDDKQ